MIIFHQGLPRSGKSYEAVITILAELKKGRQVFTNIDGINFEKFSQLSGISLEKLKGDTFEVEILESQKEEFKDVYSRVYTIAEDTPVCPKCGKLMQLKNARDYKRDKDLLGLPNEFWGCMSFPLCRGTKPRAAITKYYVTKFSGFLFQLTKDDIPVIYSRVTNNSTVVIDEIQDFFPAVSKPLDKQMTEFVTQHGHRGINLLLMGQDHADCHNLFKRRIDKLIHFTKRDAVGMPNAYSWESYKLSLKGLVKLRSGSGKYNPKYFGLYKSHVDNSIDATNHQDDRSNVFKSSAFTFYIPVFLLLLCFALYYLYGFFHKSPSVSKDSVTYTKLSHAALNSAKASASDIQSVHAALHPQFVPVQSSNVARTAVPVQPTVVQSLLPVEVDYFKRIAEKYELEISGIVEGYKVDKSGVKTFEVMALIDAVDDSHHVKERFTVKELTAMGWSVKRTGYGILVAYDDYSFVVRQKPRDYFGKVSENVTNSPQITGKI